MSRVRFPEPVTTGSPPELELRLGAVTLRGTSVAARATAFAVPEAGAVLDIGRLTPALAGQPVVLVSHTHMDHLAGLLAYLNVRARFHPDEPPAVVLPAGQAESMRRALEAMPGLESVRRRFPLDEIVLGAEPGDVVALPGGVAVAFELGHSVPTLGWRLGADRESRPTLVYALDGEVQPFGDDPALLDGEVALVECTFVERNRRIAARLSRHAHLRDWIELAPRLRCDHLVLAHMPPLDPARAAVLLEPLADAFSGTVVPWVLPR